MCFVPPAAADGGRGIAISVVGVPAPCERTVTSGVDHGLRGKKSEAGAKQEKTQNKRDDVEALDAPWRCPAASSRPGGEKGRQ